MLKRASIAAAAALAMATPAFAQTFSPAGASFTMSGYLSASDVETVNCATTLYGVVSADGTSATITGGFFAPGSGPTSGKCGVIFHPNDFPWTLQPASSSTVNLLGIGMGYFLGHCSGSIFGASWTNGPPGAGAATITPVMISGAYGGCLVHGALATSPSLTITPP
ncbi:protein activator of alkane oxidation PraB [Caulobacter radicis]|uniref:protein activator of alkane oxidation PraB n=1 Tax=Caulobacter radicis TaxID=2172650 RepID=UPI000D566A1D|nr:protein activator of alkane oxidation PraB [Caulobacter radicis]PVM83910.1 protein activator of alkane oxidation PraB [Caulobacter radicis]